MTLMMTGVEALYAEKTCALTTLVEILPPYPFRGGIKVSDGGDTYLVQLRHADELAGVLVGELDRVMLPGKREPDYLENGDVLFVAKGPRNFAVYIQDIPRASVCSSHFFHLKVKEQEKARILPEFLAWQINQSAVQTYLARCGQGSVVPSLTRELIEAMPVMVPPLEAQARFVVLLQAARKEEQVLQALIENRRQMVQGIGQRILTF